MDKEIQEHRDRLKVLEKDMGAIFYKTGHLHNFISDAMEEYHQSKVKENELLHDIRLRSILENRLKSHKEDYDNAWKNLTSESKYKKEDGIDPFYRLQRMYKTKLEEIQVILDLYEA